MQILSATLKNFKSHVDRHLEFAAGTNAICGENGVGKTSVLEAIAWVLFDYSPYKTSELVRSGCGSAEVAVRFVSTHDERTYEVRRHSTSGYQLYDPQIKQRLEHERKGDVITWLQLHLGVPEGTQLDKLFSTTIGVPQGTFTADFLKSPQERKKVFDSILKVEDFQTVAQDLQSLVKYSDGEQLATQHHIDLCQVELREWDPLQTELQELEAKLAANSHDLQQIHSHLVAERQAEMEMTAWAQTLQALDQQIQTLVQQGSEQRIHLQQAEAAFRLAEAAQRDCVRYQPDFEGFLSATQRWQDLTQQQSHRQRLSQQREALLSQHQQMQNTLTRLQAERDRLDKVEAEIQTLQPRLQEQQSLESRQEQLIGVIQQVTDIQQCFEVMQTRHQGWQQQRQRVFEILTEARQALLQHQASRQGSQVYRQAEQQIQQIEQALRQRQHLQQDWEQVSQALNQEQVKQAGLQEKFNRYQLLEQQILSIQPQVQRQTQLEKRQGELLERIQTFQSLRLELTHVEAQQHQLHQQRVELESQLHKRQALVAEVNRIPEVETQQERLTQQLSRIAAARQFEQELQRALQQGKAGLSQHQQEIRQLHTVLKGLSSQHPQLERIQTLLQQGSALTRDLVEQLELICRDLSGQLSEVSLRSQQQALQQELKSLRGSQRLTDQVPQLQADLEHCQAQLSVLGERLDELTWSLDGEVSNRRQLDDLHLQLQELADPRGRLTLWQQELQTRSTLEREWQDGQQRILAQQQQVHQLEHQLRAMAHLDAELARWQQVRTQSQAEHQLFLKTEDLAATVPLKEKDLAQAEQELNLAHIELTGLQAGLHQLEQEHGSQAQLTSHLAQIEQQLQALNNPRVRMAERQKELQQRPQLERDWLRIQQEWQTVQGEIAQMDQQLAQTSHLVDAIAEQQTRLEQHRDGFEHYRQAEQQVKTLPEKAGLLEQWTQAYALTQAELAQVQAQREPLARQYDPQRHQHLLQTLRDLEQKQVHLEANLAYLRPSLERVTQRLQDLETVRIRQQQYQHTQQQQEKLHHWIQFMREVYKKAGPRLTELYLSTLNTVADRLFREILNRPNVTLTWGSDYDIQVQEGGSRRRFAMLSGGEQMSAALAVRLALLKVLADIDIAFFDEPTTNMDQQRRQRLAEAIDNLKSLKQLFVISHDDTFEQITGHVIRIEREDPYGA